MFTGGDYEAVVLPEDEELAGFVPLLSIAYTPVYVAHGTADRVRTHIITTNSTAIGPHHLHTVHRCSPLLYMLHVASLCVNVCVCWAHGRAVQKWLNQLRCHLGTY